MNKKIKINADENKIDILVNGKLTATIKNENKSEVSGDLIYNSLDYSPNDEYELEPFDVKEDVAKKNYKAAEMIHSLYSKIVEGIGSIEVKIPSSDDVKEIEE